MKGREPAGRLLERGKDRREEMGLGAEDAEESSRKRGSQGSGLTDISL